MPSLQASPLTPAVKIAPVAATIVVSLMAVVVKLDVQGWRETFEKCCSDVNWAVVFWDGGYPARLLCLWWYLCEDEHSNREGIERSYRKCLLIILTLEYHTQRSIMHTEGIATFLQPVSFPAAATPWQASLQLFHKLNVYQGAIHVGYLRNVVRNSLWIFFQRNQPSSQGLEAVRNLPSSWKLRKLTSDIDIAYLSSCIIT